MKAKTLKNKRLGITEYDIKDCSDLAQLLEWKIEIDKDIGEMMVQINMAKAEASNGNYADPVWFANVHGAKKCQGLLSQMIQLRLVVLKDQRRTEDREDKMREDAKAGDRLQLFLQIAAEELDEKTFKSLLRKTENAVKKQEQLTNNQQIPNHDD